MVKKLTKQYETPSEGWSEERIQEENQLTEDYGLKNKREIYKAKSQLRAFRREARKLASSEDEERKKEVIGKANRLGLIREDAGLEEILTLNVTDILDRRLQTAVNRRGYSDTPNEARQLVNHGHVYVDGQKVTVPGYMLTQEEEKEVEVKLPEPNTEEADDSADEAEEVEESENSEEESEQQEGEE